MAENKEINLFRSNLYFSNKYLLMCARAKELQEQWEPKVGDIVLREFTLFGKKVDVSEIEVLTYDSIDGYFHAVDEEGRERIFNTAEDLHKKTSMWLPTQSQIQGLIGIDCDCGYLWLHQLPELNKFLDVLEEYEMDKGLKALHEGDEYNALKTWKEIWLAFYMAKENGKYWDDGEKEWIEIEMGEDNETDM